VPVRAATTADLDDVLALLTARDRAAFGEVEIQRRYLEHDLAQTATDCLVSTGPRRVTGYATLDDARDASLAATDDPTADELLAAVEVRARERGFDHLACTAVPEDTILWQLLERRGFVRERDVLRLWRRLDTDLTAPCWPEGITVRTFTAADGERVHELLDAIYAGWDPDYVEREHGDWLAFMTAHDDFDPTLWFLGERNGDLVACALHWRPTNGDGWVKDIAVRETERGRGLGTALLQHAFREYSARGSNRVGLKVDSNNPTGALRLYESVGFSVDRTYRIWAKQL
jgi:ribosomal protein S18 acetylase RimI-like enzyme